MFEFLYEMSFMVQPFQRDCVTEVDQLVLTARVYAQPDVRGKWKIDMTLSTPQPNGQLALAVAMGQVAYYGPPPAQ